MGVIIKEFENPRWTNLRNLIEDGRLGRNPFLPNPHNRMESTFNIVPGRFTLLGSTSGAGKSSFIDDFYVLKTNKLITTAFPNAKFEVLYYAMERNVESKDLKWLAWTLYDKYGWILTPRQLAGRDLKKINSKVLKGIDDCGRIICDLMDKVHIYDRRISASLIKKHVNQKARELGTLYVSDDVGVQIKGKDKYIASFAKNQLRRTQDGSTEMYLELDHKGQKFVLTQNQHKYFPHNPQTYLFIVLDGVGIIDATGFSSTKAAVDNVTNLLADARDVYSFNPVMVSQFNRGISDSQRAKMHGSALAPQESDFKDSSNMYQAADLVIGLFDPFKHKAYDKQGFYGGYDVCDGMMTASGHNRFRTAHILKNTYGKDAGRFGLRFTGEVGNFSILPRPDSPDMQRVYAEIASGY